MQPLWCRRALPVAVAVALLGSSSTLLLGQQASQVVGQVRQVVVARGESLRMVGSRYGVDPATIAADNGIALNRALAIGQQLTIEARHVVPRAVTSGVVVVNVPQRMVFVGGPEGTRGWPVAVGRRSWPTPLGAFTVMTRERHPTWDVPASIMEEARRAGRTLPPSVPPGPDNPLGDYWLGLSIGGVGIHGTNAPSSIYQAVTHGCIRMQPDDIAELFAAVAVGTRGTVIYEPILVAMDGEDLVLEVHPDVYRRGPVNGEAYVREQVAGLAPGAEVDWARVASVLAEKAGVPRAISSRANGRARPE